MGRFWCRQCGVSGDSIAFLQKVYRMSFQDACHELGIVLPRIKPTRSSRYQKPPTMPKEQQPWEPKVYQEPGLLWQEKAGNLLNDCRKRLASMPNEIRWLEERGITRSMMDNFQLGFNQKTRGGDRYRPRQSWGLPRKVVDGQEKKLWLPRGWVIPAFNGKGELVQLRIRRMDEDIKKFAANIKYLPVDGSSSATMILHPNAEVFICVESGFDAILLAGTMSSRIGVITSWNSSARPDRRADRLLQEASLVLGGLDYDQGGDREQAWWASRYKHYTRLPALPNGAKDPGDAFAQGADLHAWVLSGLGRGMQIKLGYLGSVKKKERQEKQPVHQEPEQAVRQEHRPEVVEMDLTNGTTIYLTNDPQRWQELTDQGKPVFSQKEMANLHTAISEMEPEEKLKAGLKVIEMKKMFGGVIKAGRKVPGLQSIEDIFEKENNSAQ